MSQFIKKNLLLIVLIITGVLFFSFVAPFLAWILLAGIVAMALNPIRKEFFVNKLHFSRSLSVYGLLGAIVLFSIPFVFSFVSIFYSIKDQLSELEGSESIATVEMLIDQAYAKVGAFEKVVPKEKAIEYTRQAVEKSVSLIISGVSKAFKHLPHFLLSLFFFSASLFYFITDSKQIRKHIEQLYFVNKKHLAHLIDILRTSCQSTLYAAILTGFTQAMIIALPSKALGFDFFIITFFITFFLSQIPLVGTAPAALFILGYFYVNGNIPAMVTMIGVGVLAGVADNVVRVWFLNRYDSLHPLAGFFAALGGMVILGPLGVLIGPVITMVFFKLVKTEMLQSETQDPSS